MQVLSAIDVSRAVPLLKRQMDEILRKQSQEDTSVLIVGAGKVLYSSGKYFSKEE